MVVFSVIYLMVFALHEVRAGKGPVGNDALDSNRICNGIAGFAFHR